MIIKIKTLIYRENFMSTETFTYFFRRISTYYAHVLQYQQVYIFNIMMKRIESDYGILIMY